MASASERRPPGFFGGEPRSESSDSRVPLWQFLGPRYWRAWLLIGWLKLAALLPWRFSLALHRQLGRWLGQRSRKAARLVAQNLERCFPELSAAQRAELAAEYFANMGAIGAELAQSWFGSLGRIVARFEVEGREHLEQALAGGRGAILFLGHFTTMEICGVGVAQHVPGFTITYNKRRNRLLSEYQRRGRERLERDAFAKHEVRALLRCLRDNAVVWFAGDEAHTGKSSAMLPFFGVPALTNTSLSRLARVSGAAVVPLFYRRKASGTGYLLRFGPALEAFPSDDPIADTRRLIAVLEEQIRECPAQYFWKQKRFRHKRGEAVDPGPAASRAGRSS